MALNLAHYALAQARWGSAFRSVGVVWVGARLCTQLAGTEALSTVRASWTEVGYWAAVARKSQCSRRVYLLCNTVSPHLSTERISNQLFVQHPKIPENDVWGRGNGGSWEPTHAEAARPQGGIYPPQAESWFKGRCFANGTHRACGLGRSQVGPVLPSSPGPQVAPGDVCGSRDIPNVFVLRSHPHPEASHSWFNPSP